MRNPIVAADSPGTDPWRPTRAAEAPDGRGSKSFVKRHRRFLLSLLGAAAVIAFYYYVIPQIMGLGSTLHRLRSGDKWWLGLGVLVDGGHELR